MIKPSRRVPATPAATHAAPCARPTRQPFLPAPPRPGADRLLETTRPLALPLILAPLSPRHRHHIPRGSGDVRVINQIKNRKEHDVPESAHDRFIRIRTHVRSRAKETPENAKNYYCNQDDTGRETL